MKILGFSHLEPYAPYYHDTNIGYVEHGCARFAASEERYSRIKHHAGFPVGALAALARETGCSMADVDLIALPERRFAHSPPPHAVLTNSTSREWPVDVLRKASGIRSEVWHCDHQLAHASVAFRLSPFDRALVVTLDGMGHDGGRMAFGGVFRGEGNTLARLVTCPSEGNSLGLLFGCVTEALGWRMSDGEGKTMGLAAYGSPEVLFDEILSYAPKVEGTALVGGRIFKPLSAVANCRHVIHDAAIADLRSLAERAGPENLAAAAQAVLEQVTMDWIGALLRAYPEKQVCLGGGVFMNVAANARLRETYPAVDFFVPPAPADNGIGLGAALEAAAQDGAARDRSRQPQFLGSGHDSHCAAETAAREGLVVTRVEDAAASAAALIARGEVIGVYHGRSEWGPRALGNRSVLAHPGIPGMRERINTRMKRREHFMPFAPAILAAHLGEWFEGERPSPYMMFTVKARASKAPSIASVLHRDGTGRVQTVTAEDNPLLHAILLAFRGLTGLPLLLNTSFNLHGQPLVDSPSDALQHLHWGCVDRLLMEDRLVSPAHAVVSANSSTL
jgi:carbamoyltransferase